MFRRLFYSVVLLLLLNPFSALATEPVQLKFPSPHGRLFVYFDGISPSKVRSFSSFLKVASLTPKDTVISAPKVFNIHPFFFTKTINGLYFVLEHANQNSEIVQGNARILEPWLREAQASQQEIVFVGYSAGGQVAMHVAELMKQRAPEVRIARIITIETPIFSVPADLTDRMVNLYDIHDHWVQRAHRFLHTGYGPHPIAYDAGSHHIYRLLYSPRFVMAMKLYTTNVSAKIQEPLTLPETPSLSLHGTAIPIPGRQAETADPSEAN